jgi:hypothetical protein
MNHFIEVFTVSNSEITLSSIEGLFCKLSALKIEYGTTAAKV